MTDQARILFVDDEPQILKSIRRHFLDEPYEVLTASSAKEGLKMLEDTPAEVVVSDYRMPEMNGGEFLKRVSEQWPETSRLVLSGHADLSAVITAINDGEIFKFIGKPWNDHELKNAVHDGVEKYRSLMNLKRVAGESLNIAADLFSEGLGQRAEMHSRNMELEKQVSTLRKYEAVFNSLNIPIVFFDKAGDMLELNIAALHYFDDAGLSVGADLLEKGLPDDLRCAIWNTLNGMEADLQNLRITMNNREKGAVVVPLSMDADYYEGAVLLLTP